MKVPSFRTVCSKERTPAIPPFACTWVSQWALLETPRLNTRKLSPNPFRVIQHSSTGIQSAHSEPKLTSLNNTVPGPNAPNVAHPGPTGHPARHRGTRLLYFVMMCSSSSGTQLVVPTVPSSDSSCTSCAIVSSGCSPMPGPSFASSSSAFQNVVPNVPS